jgi:hypothetical protein
MGWVIPADEWPNNHDFFKLSDAAECRKAGRFMLQTFIISLLNFPEF